MPRLVLGEPLQLLQVSELFLLLSFLGSTFWNVLLDHCIIAFALPTLPCISIVANRRLLTRPF